MSTADLVSFAIRYAVVIDAFSPGAWQRSEEDVAQSAAARGPDHTPESEPRSATDRETERQRGWLNTGEMKMTYFFSFFLNFPGFVISTLGIFPKLRQFFLE